MSVTGQSTTERQTVQRRFLGIAVIVLLVYAGLWGFYSTPELLQMRALREVMLWAVTFGLLYLYWKGYRLIRTGLVPMRSLIAFGLLTGLAAVLIPPFHSTDVFGYINRGWQQWHYGMNPYVHTVDHIPNWENDPMITDHWVNNPSPYGFLYLLIAKALCWLGGGDKAQTLLVFKLGNLLVFLMTAALIGLGARYCAAHDPGEHKEKSGNDGKSGVRKGTESSHGDTRDGAVTALYLWLWNPLLLLHGLSNAHNDLLMGFFVSLSAYAALVGAWLWILPALMAATLIKYAALVIMPLAGLFLLRRKTWGALAGGILISLLIFAGTGWPFLGDFEHFHLKQIERNAFVSHGSLHSFFYSAYKTLGKELIPALYAYKETARTVLKNILLFGYAVFYMCLCWRRLRQVEYTAHEWLRDALLVMAVMVCLVSLKFYPWYFGMFLPLAMYLPPSDWLRRVMLVMSGAQLFSITFIGQAHFLNFLVMTAAPIAWIVWDLKKKNRPENGTDPA